jgi:hypothetical protein
MNIQTVADNLRVTIAGKEEYLAEWNNADITETADRIHRATIVGMLTINIDELKRILQDVEQCCEKATADSWALNPDRSGGAFTDEEINRGSEWR